MASAFTHAFTAFAIGKVATDEKLPVSVWAAGMFCAVVPDADAIGYFMHVDYGSAWGHRGMTHSILFAMFLAGLLAWLLTRDTRLKQRFVWLCAYLSICGISHGVLDAMTTGGLGVAFLAPFDSARYFFPWRPILVSPIGVSKFFGEWGMRVIVSELKWVWLPLSLFAILARIVRSNIKSA